ncbi:general transcription factor 3C polypeptide 6 [Hoplias malabaricus]|uniref:general transcription factor 3C polypeptide 6 n=1 Tax=Hoplias malabaricus TaxID=27720 RepID=UPI0034629E22
MEEEWEEDEELVVAELSGVIDSEVLRRCEGGCKAVALDSEQPVLQLGRYVFAGEYEDTAGTCVIFQEETGQHALTPALRYKCHTVKKLVLQRTFLCERKEGESGSSAIELLSLNEGEVSGRSISVCHYILDPTELERVQTEEQEPGASDSDPETTEKRSAQQHRTESETAPIQAQSTVEKNTVNTHQS